MNSPYTAYTTYTPNAASLLLSLLACVVADLGATEIANELLGTIANRIHCRSLLAAAWVAFSLFQWAKKMPRNEISRHRVLKKSLGDTDSPAQLTSTNLIQ
jgi:hypothetical protein